jgi:malonate decarboxylase epsilon subunit
VLAFQYPGQGAQAPGFLHRLPPHPAIAATLDEATEALGVDALSFDTAEALRSTVAVQVSMVIAGVAMLRLLAANGIAPDVSAGLSVGAYAAAVSCGALRFDDALRMVHRRGELMEAAYPSGYGLVAVAGLLEHELESIAAAQLSDGAPPVYIGNVNALRQIVMAGSDKGLELLIERALVSGARKAVRLSVSVPSHCELLADAADALMLYARDVPFDAPRSVYMGNRGGRPLYDAESIRDDLATNMRYTVRWFDALTAMREMGAQVYLEAPPGQVLTDIVREQWPETVALACSNIAPQWLTATVRRRIETELG